MAKKKKAKKVSTPVVCFKASDAVKFKVGEEVLVYGGGLYESEFERGSEATVEEFIDDEGMYRLTFDDGHTDLFLTEQIRKITKKKIGVGRMG